MDEPAVTKPDRPTKLLKGPAVRDEGGGEDEDDDSSDDEECDAEVWDTLSRSFRQAQSVLDQNRAFIQQRRRRVIMASTEDSENEKGDDKVQSKEDSVEHVPEKTQ